MKNEVKVLIVEDNPADVDLIREYLSDISEFDAKLHSVSTLREAKEYLQSNTVQAALVDLSLPDSRGVDTLKEVVNHLQAATVIVLTSLNDRNTAMDAMASGAQDYLLKDALGPEVLERVIRYSMQRSKWVNKLHEIQHQLFVSQKMESIGRMAGGLAHDFNNQLGAIGLLSSLIQDTLTPEHECQKQLETLQTVVNKSASITRRLMVFCRQHPMEMRELDVSDVLKECDTLLRKILGESVSFNTKYSEDAHIMADSAMLEQAVMNLVINARDAMPEGGRLDIEVSLSKSAASDSKTVQLRISDTGTGISKDIIQQVFEPFFTTKEVGKGTGLGLSMVYGAIKQFGGSIEVESEEGKGTSFILSFPHRPIKFVSKVMEVKTETKFGSETIMVVEDESILRDLFVQIFTKKGYKVISASCGVEALKLVENEKQNIDLLFTDIVMPEVSGLELAQILRSKNPNLKIVFSSGYSSDLLDQAELTSMNAHFLPKPVSAKTLSIKIREVLDA